MSGKPIIPPAVSGDNLQPQEMLQVLSKRLAVTESDTNTLVEQMNKCGISRDNALPTTNQSDSSSRNKSAQLTYDTLVSRVCKAESAVQTLKLSLLRVQSQMDLSKKDNTSVEDRITQVKHLHEQELKKLRKEVKEKVEECEEINTEKRRLQNQVKQLEEALDITSTAKTDVAMETEQLNITKTKLQRRIAELKDDLFREKSLRGSLEESQNTLLARVKDMEIVIEREQEEVKNINATCCHLKQDVIQTKENLKVTLHQKQQAETKVLQLTSEHEKLLQKIRLHEDDKDLLLSEFKKLRQKYNELNAKLQRMQGSVKENKADHDSLSQANKKLSEAMKSAASENADMIARYEAVIEKHKAEAADRKHLEEKIKKLEGSLCEKSKEKARLECKIAELEEKVNDVTAQKDELEMSKVELEEKLKQEHESLMTRIKTSQQEKMTLLNRKDEVLEELKSQIERMSEENDKIVEESQRALLEAKTLERTKHQMEQENRRLVERIGVLEEQQGAQQNVEQTMADLTEQKNKLAYDKGRLQSRVDQLQSDIDTLASQSMEYVQMKKMNSLLENKLQKTQTQLNSCEIMVQRLEAQLKQVQSSGERKEDDFVRVLKARDDIAKEKNKLQQQLDVVEERERQRVQGLQKNLFDAREDNKKMATTLEGLMKTHCQIQDMLEDLQLQLGRRDATVVQLESEKTKLQATLKELEMELVELKSVVSKNEDIKAKQVEPLRQALQKCKEDNGKLSNSLETFVQTNSQLQARVVNLEDELQKKGLVIGKMKKAREKDSEDHKQEVRKYEERLENLRQQLNIEREKALKKNTKDLNEVKKKNDDVISRNGELSRTNQELRHKITECEAKEKELQEKILAQNRKIEYMSRVRNKQDEMLNDMSDVGRQLRELEDTKNRYIKKNEEQAQMIQNFVSQISSLQSEFKTLVHNQIETADLLKQQEVALVQERKYNEALRKKLKETKKREANLEQLRQETENRLKEANDETLNITHGLEDAHTWFKSKFDSLQQEIAQSKKSQTELEFENSEAKVLLALEKQRAEETASKARDMIKASRETISRLADYAELTQKERDAERLELKLRLKEEKESSQDAKLELSEFKESSFRHAELLARELDYLKHKAALFYNS